MKLSAGHYFGVKRAAVGMGDLMLSECLYAQQSELPQHSHENAYLILVLDGTQLEDLRGTRRSYQRGALALHPAQEMHSQQIGPQGFRCLHVEFGATWLKENPQVSRALEKPAHFDTSRFPVMGHTARSMYQEFRDMDDLSPLAIEGCVLSLLAEINRTSSVSAQATPQWLKKARDTLHDGYCEPLSLKTLGTSVGVHPVHLAREFRRNYRYTVAEYIRRLRIHSACEAIRRSEAPLSQIALDSGFADQAHFTRVFKRVIGMTPGQFRIRNNPR